MAPDLQLDLASAIARIWQAHAQPDMAYFLLDRLATCDMPRLAGHLDARGWQMLRDTEERIVIQLKYGHGVEVPPDAG